MAALSLLFSGKIMRCVAGEHFVEKAKLLSDGIRDFLIRATCQNKAASLFFFRPQELEQGAASWQRLGVWQDVLCKLLFEVRLATPQPGRKSENNQRRCLEGKQQ
jgi:hypothetical protein